MGRRFLLALLLAFLLPGAAASSTAVSIQDPPGDVVSSGPSGAFPYIDLTEVRLELEDMVLRLEADYVSLDPQPYGYYIPSDTWVEIEFSGERFRLNLVWSGGIYGDDSPQNIFDPTVWQIYRYQEDQEAWQLIQEGQASQESTTTIVAMIPLEHLRTTEGFQPGEGSRLHVLSVFGYWDSDSAPAHERMANDGLEAIDAVQVPDSTYLEIPGDRGGFLSFNVKEAVRFSNGAATTYHWPIQVRLNSPGEVLARVELVAEDELQLYGPGIIQLSGDAPTPLDVYVTTPFRHAHGGSREIVVNLEVEGQTRASTTLSIVYLEIPQPSGHHSTLTLHGSDRPDAPLDGLWMNAEPIDDRANLAQFDPEVSACDVEGSYTSTLGWTFPLHPGWSLGLDARPGEAARLAMDLVTDVPLQGYDLLARFGSYTVGVDEQGYVGPGNLTARVVLPDLLPGETFRAELELPMDSQFDYVEPEPNQNLDLRVLLCPRTLVAGQPSFLYTLLDGVFLSAGATLELPLDEFHEPIDLELRSVGMELLTDASRAPPGAEVGWRVAIPAQRADDYRFEVLGSLADSATIGSTVFTGDRIEVPVTLRLPEDARPEDAINLVLVAEHRSNPVLGSAIRLVATVESDVGPPSLDEVLAGPSARNTPGTGSFVLIAGVGAVATLARGRSA